MATPTYAVPAGTLWTDSLGVTWTVLGDGIAVVPAELAAEVEVEQIK